ncbi:MAG: hypothetical protein IKL68_00930 [Clostridia bacterium]|nr:hypothetical protein [Clostridia bacterium]
MRINLGSVCYPKPILCELVDDYIDNEFKIELITTEYNKEEQKLAVDVKTIISNETILDLINQGKIVVVLHLEQKTQRKISVLSCNDVTHTEIDLYKYATTEPIEVVAILYVKETFTLPDNRTLNDVYRIMGSDITYERGDIAGYSNETKINLPEDKRIGSIFNLIPDNDNTLGIQPFKVSLNSELIQILMQKDIHEKFVQIYKKSPVVKRMMFFNIVEPAVVSAYTEMFMQYETYKDKKWCRTLASKVENDLHIQADEIFVPSNYELEKAYRYTNLALGKLFEDSINTLEKGFGE